MDRERALEVFVTDVLKVSVKPHFNGEELSEEDKEILLSLLCVIEYYSLKDDYEEYYAKNKSLIDTALGTKNVPANTFTVTCVEENEDGSADIEIEMGSGMKDKVLEAGINFLLMKSILEGTTSDILNWATRGKQEIG